VFAILSAGVLAGGLLTITGVIVSAVMSLVLTFAALAVSLPLSRRTFSRCCRSWSTPAHHGAVRVRRHDGEPRRDHAYRPAGLVTRAAGSAAGYVFYRVAWLVGRERSMPFLAASATPPVKDFGTVSSVGLAVFGFLFPFEAISLLLLLAVIAG